MRRKEVILPKIHKPVTASTSGWYIYFSVYNEYTDKMQRFRRGEGFSKCSTYEECSILASRMKRKYHKKLVAGWTPFHNEEVIWSDSLVYQEQLNGIKRVRRSKRNIPYFLSLFLEKHCTELSKGSYDKYRSELRIFKEWLIKNKLDNIDISEFTEENAKQFFEFLDTEGRKGNTKNSYLNTIRSVWKIIISKYRYIKDPFCNIPRYKKRTIHQLPLKRGILEIIKTELELKDPQLWLAAQFMYYCFIRPKEIRFMKIRNIDLYDGKITLESTITKANKTRTVEIPNGFLNELIGKYKLNSYPESYYIFTIKGNPGEKPVGKNYFWTRFNDVRTRLNIPKDYKFYGFKHTGAVSALKAGANIKDIQHQMGHSSIDITDQYLKSMVGYETEFFRKEMPSI